MKDNFDKWFTIIIVTIVLVLFAAFVVYLGWSFGELINTQKDLL